MKENHIFGAEISKVLKLMIHSLYTNKDIFLRELISNASDACDKLRYQATHTPGLLEGDAALAITLSVDKAAKTLTIADNGIGMNREELIANLGTIAKSGTQEFMQALTINAGDDKTNLPLIGQFGVGFYAAFVVAERVLVVSRKAGEGDAYAWESNGEGEFSIEPYAPTEGELPRGTRVTLTLKAGEEDYLDSFRLRHIVTTYSDHISFPILFKDEDEKTESLNKGSALWTRAKSEIAPEQYIEFYHHVSHLPDTPWLTLHNKAEGKLEYTSLLYVPSMQPFDLFHPERKRSVKLYVKRVFITDEGVELVPHYLRFLRGIVDSEDLPLNISRETLQYNAVIGKIRDAIVTRVLNELKKKGEKEPGEYAAFWKNFGAVLKEGLCEGIAPKEEILDACRFHSTHSPELTSLGDYIGRMKEGQETIFYLTGERQEMLATSPQLEGFQKRGVEVLLFSDHVDDFWVNVVSGYQGKSFKSITRSNIDLDKIAPLPDAPTETTPANDMEALIAVMKAIYGEQVKDVRITHKLEGSALCLAVEEGAMDIRFERFLREQKQLATTSAKIVEINPAHSVIRALARNVASGAAAEDAVLRDTTLLLLDQAKIVEGEEITDPAAFSRRLGAMLAQSLAA